MRGKGMKIMKELHFIGLCALVVMNVLLVV